MVHDAVFEPGEFNAMEVFILSLSLLVVNGIVWTNAPFKKTSQIKGMLCFKGCGWLVLSVNRSFLQNQDRVVFFPESGNSSIQSAEFETTVMMLFSILVVCFA